MRRGRPALCMVMTGVLSVPTQEQTASTLPGLITLIPFGQTGKPESAGLGCWLWAARLVRELWNLRLSCHVMYRRATAEQLPLRTPYSSFREHSEN